MRLETGFGTGISYPYNVLLLPSDRDAKRPTPVLSSAFYKSSRGLMKRVQKELLLQYPDAGETSFALISYLAGSFGAVEPDFQVMSNYCAFPGMVRPVGLPGPGCDLVNMFCNTGDYRKQPPTATSGFIVPPVDHMSPEDERFLNTVRDLLELHGPSFGIDAFVTGTSVYAIDMIRSVYDFFPLMVVVTLGTATLFLAVVFRFVVLPLRAVCANCLTLGFAYGLAVLVYQDGRLDFLGWYAVGGDLGALPWLVPPVVFFLLTGLGLDYDIFLCVRITEFRSMGEAIRKGLISIVGIINSAGLVMVFAFGAMLLSQMQQLITVLYLMWVVVGIVNPASMSLLGHANWWPSDQSRPKLSATLLDHGMSLQVPQEKSVS